MTSSEEFISGRIPPELVDSSYAERISNLPVDERVIAIEGLRRTILDLNQKLKDSIMDELMPHTFSRQGFWNHGGHNYIQNTFMRNDETPKWHVIFTDIVDLGGINNRYGHNEGDNVLRAFDGVIHASLRAEDVALRWGGDEVVLFVQGEDNTHEKVVERLHDFSRIIADVAVPRIDFIHNSATLDGPSRTEIEAAITRADPKGKDAL